MSRKPLATIEEFLKGESLAGLLLMAAAVLALVVANSPLAATYEAFLHLPISVSVGSLALDKSLVHWVNDGLMAVFFLLVGLEIKREVVGGELSSRASAALPALAALGGMAGPAIVYVALNWGHAETLGGWAIPTATDIAFALGIMSLLGSRVPASLKIFLTALAVIDDLGAIVIIAIFYSGDLSTVALSVAAVCVAVLFVLNRAGVRRIDIYIAVGLVLWVSVLKSGVHATMAGVITALAIPAGEDSEGHSALQHLEHKLHPWVTYFILPLFAFANAGVAMAAVTREALTSTLTLGIAFGLLVGKQAGVLVFTGLARLFGWVQWPEGVTPLQFYGVALLTGVGFTMSLFIGTLAFADPVHIPAIKVGVLAGSLLSGIAGYACLRLGAPKST